jgi:hypothetical protein
MQEKEELKETVILSPLSLMKESPPPLKEGKEILPETVILKLPRSDIALEEKGISKETNRFNLPKKGDVSDQGDDFLAETVILGSEKEVPRPTQRTSSKDPRKSVGQPVEDDILSETVIIGSGKVRGKEKDGKKR